MERAVGTRRSRHICGRASALNPEPEIEAFTRRHVELTRRNWTAEGRCMNWFITGPARIPVARNEKRMKISDARRADLAAHSAAARKAVKRKAFPQGADDEPIRSGDPSALQRIMAKIEDLALSIGKMKAAKSVIRRMEKDGADDAAMIAAIVARTGSAEVATRGVVLADWQWKRGFDTAGQPCRNPPPTRAAEISGSDAERKAKRSRHRPEPSRSRKMRT